MDGPTFDELTRALRSAATRRQAAGGLLGLGLAALTGRELTDAARKHRGKHKTQAPAASSQAKGAARCTPNNACAHFCAAVFGADTPAAGKCTSDAIKCQGLCSATSGCLTGKPPRPNPQLVCCPGGTCSDYASATCCAAAQVCLSDGTCCTKTTCAKQGANCGSIGDGCGGKIASCGTCSGYDTCGGGGTPNVCGCTKKTCAKDYAGQCGDGFDDGCGGTLSCACGSGCCASGTCKPGTTTDACGAGGKACRACAANEACDNGACVCPYQTCAASGCCAGANDVCDLQGTCCTPQCNGKNCGDPNGCGGTCDAACPPSCFCYSAICLTAVEIGTPCQSDNDCHVPGMECRFNLCGFKFCSNNPGACPAGSRCLAASASDSVCLPLCTST